MGGVRLAEREIEAASRWVQRTENSFLYPVRRVWFASDVGFDRGIGKTEFLNIHEAQNTKTWGRSFGTNGRSRPRADGCRGRTIRFCIRCAAFGSRPASGSTAGSEKTWVFGAK